MKKIEESENGREKYGNTINYLKHAIDLNNTNIEEYFKINKESEGKKKGTDWEEVSEYICKFVDYNRGYAGYIREEIKSDDSDILGELRNCIIEVSNCFQGKNIDDKSNISISKKMQEEISRVIGE